MSSGSPVWTPEAQARWARIVAHPIGGAEGSQVFLLRLAREQVWHPQRAAAALEEYRRFVFLTTVCGEQITPSPAVDAVWHLHLLFTRDYWEHFGPEVLGRTLHHLPALSDGDAPRHRAQYAATLRGYRQWFGPPPAGFWPEADAAQAPAHRREPRARAPRWLRALLTAGAVAAPALAWAQSPPSNPLDWSGPEFIRLYLVLMLVTGVASLLLRRVLRRSAEAPVRSIGPLDAFQTAFLVGGPQRVIDVGVAELHARGVVRWDAGASRLVRDVAERLPEPMLETIAALALERTPGAGTVQAAAKALLPLRARLEQLGLWLTPEAARRIALLSALPALALAAFGAAKIAIGISRDRPVGFLILLCVLTLVFAAIMYVARPGRSAAGDRERSRLLARPRPAQNAGQRPGSLAMAVALGGSAVFAGTALAGYHQQRLASSSGSDGGSGSSSDSGSSDGSGDSGGGSGCGGCGGGGD